MSRKRWTKACPREPGDYLMRCGECDYEPEPVKVFWLNDALCASDYAFPRIAVRHLHDGLTDVTWRKA